MEEQKEISSLKENILLVTVILLSLFGVIISINFICILFFLFINFLVFNNVRRINVKNPNNFKLTIRRLLYILPFLLPVFLGVKIDLYFTKITLIYMVIVLLFVAIVIYFQKGRWEIAFDDYIISLGEKKDRFDYISNIILICVAPFFEEFFFRNFVIHMLRDKLGIFSIIFSGFLFWLQHYELYWSESFGKKDFVIQFLFGLVLGFIFYVSNSLVPCILGHLAYNSMNAFLEMKRYHFYYVRNGVLDE